MGLWSLIQPQATTNLVPNPSFERNENGWLTNFPATFVRDTSKQRYGAASGKCTPSTSPYDGVGTHTGQSDYWPMVVVGQLYTLSLRFLGAVGVPYKVFLDMATGYQYTTTWTGTGEWQTITLSGIAGRTYAWMNITKNNHASVAPFWIDGVQLELGGDATSYCDGDQPGCRWLGGLHTSASSRPASERRGGVIVDLNTFGITIDGTVGAGVPQLDSSFIPLSGVDGSAYQNTRTKQRDWMLHATIVGTTWQDFHSKRKAFFAAINPTGVVPSQPVTLVYTGGSVPVFINAYYDDGLGFGSYEGFTQKLQLKLISDDPYWRTEFQQGATLGANNAITPTYCAQRSPLGVWSNLGSGTNNLINAMVEWADGDLYAGGAFTTAGGIAGRSFIGRWSSIKGTWIDPNMSMNAQVRSLVVWQANLYLGGDFTTGSGNTLNYVGKYDPVNGIWQALGTGMNAAVYCLAVNPLTGDLYAGGAFTTAGGVTVNGIAKWNGTSWSALGSGVSSGIVTSIVVLSNGDVIAGGTFTSASGVANTVYVARWNGTSWSALDQGLGATVSGGGVNAMIVLSDGRVVVGGKFTPTLGTAQGVNAVAVWNGSGWSKFPTLPANTTITALTSYDDTFAMAGDFASFGNRVAASPLALWGNGVWKPLECGNIGTTAIKALIQANDGTLYAGLPNTATAAAGVNAVTNGGSVATEPVFVITATSAKRLWQILNTTNNKAIYFNNLSIQSGEIITIDCRANTITSNLRGNLLSTVVSGSNLADFQLESGTNNLNVYAESGVSVNAWWEQRHWSLDGGAN